ncbi:hypothetical protein AGOR_G00131220 [Albula goreensis]|uniref:Integrin beta n=1 Tax=Albula goreensis TaxID=1534307 RepID=A0A8T3D7V3_9TELE|nr:hypothetical protein AGOR_G00131220 [Albula goreensis]
MKWVWLATALLLHCTEVRGTVGSRGGCQVQSSCVECVRMPGCAWCKQKDFLQSGEAAAQRCDTPEGLRRRNCSLENVMDPRPVRETVRDDEHRSGPGAVVQLRPQNLHLKLRVGVPQTFEVKFKRSEGYPIDLYYLMDFSYSMRDDLAKVKTLGRKILAALRNVTSTVRIGFGAFVDKPAMPFISTVESKLKHPCRDKKIPCQPSFSFKNVLPLTNDADEFERSVSQEKISSNLDNPESGLDAIMQATVCQKEIGWGKVTRILVYTSDDIFHTAGDGKLAGIYHPNDGQCHLNSEGIYDKSQLYDYPSVAHLSQVLSANNVQLIFAVTNAHLSRYKALSEALPLSVVGELKGDSSNVVQLISYAYGNLSSIILLEHLGAPPSLQVSYNSHCSDGVQTSGRRRGECSNVGINHQVNFTVTLTASVCLQRKETFVIKPQGSDEELHVTVETLCDCDCRDEEERSPYCSGNGTLSCGLCSCERGYEGQRCECPQEEYDDLVLTLDTSCRQANDTELCSGHGTCVCGQCVCQGHYTGDYCHCDPTSCSRYDNLICGGHGWCNCGVCDCDPEFTGVACQCSALTDQCLAEDGMVLCSGHGQCQCNQCHCDAGFYGEHCAKLTEPCQQYQACVECFSANELQEDGPEVCQDDCGSIRPTLIEEAQEMFCQTKHCLFQVEMDTRTGSILVSYTNQTTMNCPPWKCHRDMTLMVFLFTVSAVLLGGGTLVIIHRVNLKTSNKVMEEENKAQTPFWNSAMTKVSGSDLFLD